MTVGGSDFSVAVVGGGASGLVAAIFAAREAKKLGKKVEVTVFESNSRLGKKLLVTGNGRCNFTNEDLSAGHFRGDVGLAQSVCDGFGSREVINFFRELGLFSRSDIAGRVYPVSFQAAGVLDALRYEIKHLGINEKTDTEITSVERETSGFILNGGYRSDVCIFAAGGKAAPVHGSRGGGFALLSSFGVSPTPLYPALTPLVADDFPSGLKGIRAQGRITLKSAGKVLAEDAGELQYTDYGLSGIPAMQVSRFAAEALGSEKKVSAVVDSCPFLSEKELLEALSAMQKRNPDLPGEMLLAGIMPKRLGIWLLSECSVKPGKNIGIIHHSVLEATVRAVKEKKYRIRGVRGFDDAQVTAGGISSDDINPETLELKKVRGAYVCGEMVNVDGECGGYNLHWAWSSGRKAGISAVREM